MMYDDYCNEVIGAHCSTRPIPDLLRPPVPQDWEFPTPDKISIAIISGNVPSNFFGGVCGSERCLSGPFGWLSIPKWAIFENANLREKLIYV